MVRHRIPHINKCSGAFYLYDSMLDLDALPKFTFIMYSSTLKFHGYDLQNVPTSTGRADMVIRVIKNALFLPNEYDSDMAVMLFPNPKFLSELQEHSKLKENPDKGYLISFKSAYFQNHPYEFSSEHVLLSILYSSFQNTQNIHFNSLFSTSCKEDFYEFLWYLEDQGVSVYLLDETGKNIEKGNDFLGNSSKKVCFILGDQVGFSEINRELLPKTIIPISLGKTSHLGSTIITLIKWIIWQKNKQQSSF
jgi:tRNA pseudouridine-54 N-methylase